MTAVRLHLRWLLLAVCAVFALLFGGIVSTAQARDVLRVGMQLEPPHLDPTQGASAAIGEATFGSIYEALVRVATDGTLHPWLATRWSVSPDGRTYDFTLRPNVRFHDGSRLTSADVVAGFQRAAAPGSLNIHAATLREVVAARALDPLHVQVTLSAPDSEFLIVLAQADAAIVPARAAATLGQQPVGTGPFRLDSWRRGEGITLLRNPTYWGRPARMARIELRYIGDPTAAYAAIKSGAIDLYPEFPAPETLRTLAADPRLQVLTAPSEGEVILAMNEREGPLSNRAVRQALAHAIDRRALIDGAMYGYGTPIGSHFPPQSPDYVDLTQRYPFDPALARKLLAQAGYPHGIALTLKLPPPAYARRVGEIVAAQLQAAGVTVTIRNVEWATWLDEVFTRHHYDLTVIAHAEPYDYDIYDRPDYYFGYDSPDFHRLMQQLKATTDPLERHRLLGDIQRRLADDAVNGFLYQFPHLAVQDRALAGVWRNAPTQTIEWADVHFSDDGQSVALSGGGGGAGRLGGWIAIVLGALVLGLAGWRLGTGWLSRRLGVLGLTLLAASGLIFALVQVAPGDPAATMLGINATPQAVAALHAELGLDGNALTRYVRWIGGALHGDFGLSYTYRVPVAGLVAERLAVTVPLALLATLLSIALGIPAGILAARRPGGLSDRVIDPLTRLGIALPDFWLGVLLVLVFAVTLRWFPAGGFPGVEAGPGPVLRALALPVLALALPQAAILARVARASLIGVLQQDFIRTARAKGVGEARLLLVHALPNAAAPILAILGLQVPFLLAGSALVEEVFTLPGLGRLALQAIGQRDLVTVQAVVLLAAGATVLSSFAVDLAQALLDPRLRRARGSAGA
ncbi:ABC transporter substrate-binding protein [Novosphingobium sp.]|uniref:ABC transporter substrate-binding protein n=1 Tax=Novosphingobium sp. TaxID=1874826 RepID=UPI0038BD4AFD